VGIPSSLAQLSMSIAIIAINKVVIMAGGTDGVAVLTSGWRILMVGTIPLIGVATGVVAVTGAAYGAGDRDKLKTAFTYSVKVGLLTELTVGAIIFIFAGQLSRIFTYSEDAAHILDDLVSFLHIMCLFYPMVPLGMLTSAMFRGIGEGRKSLMATLVRTIILQIPCAYILGITLGMGLTGVWWGMIVGNAVAVSLTFLWGIYTVKKVPLPISESG
jgi:Na+-driven multidrug efflux pump